MSGPSQQSGPEGQFMEYRLLSTKQTSTQHHVMKFNNRQYNIKSIPQPLKLVRQQSKSNGDDGGDQDVLPGYDAVRSTPWLTSVNGRSCRCSS